MNPLSPLRSADEVVQAAMTGKLVEHAHSNIELKEDWSQKHGTKISALANKLDQLSSFLVIGVKDTGELALRNEAWAKKTEEVISQHINQYLEPIQACTELKSFKAGPSWLIIVSIRNPGDVTLWDYKAYAAAGTTVRELAPDETLKLRIQLPGLTDFTKQYFKCPYDLALIADFSRVIRLSGHQLESAHSPADSLISLKNLGIFERQAARILFGNTSFRLVQYDHSGTPHRQQRLTGLYRLLMPGFLAAEAPEVASHYTARILREAFANAVAHAAYFENDGEVVIEVYSDKMVISNLCHKESAYFANRWFSRSHKTINGTLMEVLRIVGAVDELGRGKHLIFAESLRQGQKAPEVFIERAGRFDRWKLVIFGGKKDTILTRLLNQSMKVYKDEQKALIAQALVLWRDKPVAEIRNYIDPEFSAQFAQVLSGIEGPIFYYREKDQITLRRWAKVLLGEGKNSKTLSPAEEQRLLEDCHEVFTKHHAGFITTRSLRELAAMGETTSERSQSSTLLKKWQHSGYLEKIGQGKYRFIRNPIEPIAEQPSEPLYDWLNTFLAKDAVRGPNIRSSWTALFDAASASALLETQQEDPSGSQSNPPGSKP